MLFVSYSFLIQIRGQNAGRFFFFFFFRSFFRIQGTTVVMQISKDLILHDIIFPFLVVIRP